MLKLKEEGIRNVEIDLNNEQGTRNKECWSWTKKEYGMLRLIWIMNKKHGILKLNDEGILDWNFD